MRYNWLVAWDIREHVAATGETPVLGFLEGLKGRPEAAAFALIELLAEHGNQLRRPQSGALGDGLFELRHKATGVRIFYMFRPGRRVVLLDGMVKKQDKLPVAMMERLRKAQNDVAASD